MAHRVIDDGPFNLSQLEYGATSRIHPQEYGMFGYQPTHYTIQVGDDLHRIATFYGIDFEELYAMNRGTLDRAAVLHGKESADGGRYLYPGTTIKV